MHGPLGWLFRVLRTLHVTSFACAQLLAYCKPCRKRTTGPAGEHGMMAASLGAQLLHKFSSYQSALATTVYRCPQWRIVRFARIT